jgi:EAL domain-containing protein (putative c-di-GMP-specific phosphodiesterase class I)
VQKDLLSLIDVPDAGCGVCQDPLGFDFTFAFQPIVDVRDRSIYAQEALVRGLQGESAASILAQVHDGNRYRFDQECRIRSILLAKQLGLTARLSINFMANAVYKPELCLRTTLAAAQAASFPVSQIIFEVLETERVISPTKLREILLCYQGSGFLTAIDDFGSGYAGLTLLADFQPSLLKIDMYLVRDIAHHEAKQAVVAGLLLTAQRLKIQVIAEGVETRSEAEWFQDHGVFLMQGYYFGRPLFRALTPVDAITPFQEGRGL